MRVTERLRLIEGGKRLEDIVTIDDPGRPSPAAVVSANRVRPVPDVELAEYLSRAEVRGVPKHSIRRE